MADLLTQKERIYDRLHLKEISPRKAFVQGKELCDNPTRMADQGREFSVQVGAEPVRRLQCVHQLLSWRAAKGASLHLTRRIICQ